MAAISLDFQEWTGGASEEEIAALKKVTEKKFKFWLLISLIPVLNWITMGFAIFCYNNLSIIKSRGRSNGNDLFRLILMIYALFIPPIFIVNLCAKFEKLGTKVLGW